MAFTNEQLERYSRHIILKEIGAKGQKKLLNGKVLIIGAGPAGLTAAYELLDKSNEYEVVVFEESDK